jgi:hypothetical protein
MQTYAIIKGNLVENIIEYDSQPTTPPPGFDDGYIAVQADRASPGWLYENGEFVDTTPPVEPMVMPPVKTLAEQILSNPDELARLKQALGL